MDNSFKSKTCGSCVFADLQPNKSYLCRRGPPLAFVVAAPMRDGIMLPNAPVQTGLATAYPPVMAEFPACGEYLDVGKKLLQS